MQKKPENLNSLKSLKYRNRMIVLTHMRKAGNVSVNEIFKETGLSKMTVHKIIDYYVDNGMVSLVGKGSSTEEGGKKPNLFAFNPNCRFIFGLRLGNDTLCTSIVNLNGESMAKTETILGDKSFDTVMDMVKANFDAQVTSNGLAQKNCLAIVVGFSGIVDAESGVCLTRHKNHKWGTNIPLRGALAKRFPPHIRIYVNSHWRYLAMGEVVAAKPGKRRRFFLMGNSGDHISGGLVENGKVMTGVNGFAGEIGHMRVTTNSDLPCICGGVGCLETMVVPSRLEAKAKQARPEHSDSLVFGGVNGGDASFKDIASAADFGDSFACELMTHAVDHFAIAINNIVQICDPGTVILYGDYVQAGDFFLTLLNDKVDRMAMPNREAPTRIEYSVTGDDWDMVGAANQVADALFV